MHFSSSLAFSEKPLFSSNHRCFVCFYLLHSLHTVHGFASNFQPYDVQKMCKNVQRENPFYFIQVPAGVKTIGQMEQPPIACQNAVGGCLPSYYGKG